MIEYRTGDLFSIPATYRVNPVNCCGVMGAGIAKIFKDRYPTMFDQYRKQCLKKQYKPGLVFAYPEHDTTIINFPTKNHWTDQSRYFWIEDGLSSLNEMLASKNQDAIVTMPALGCGLGGLNFDRVKQLIDLKLSKLDMEIIVFGPKR